MDQSLILVLNSFIIANLVCTKCKFHWFWFFFFALVVYGANFREPSQCYKSSQNTDYNKLQSISSKITGIIIWTVNQDCYWYYFETPYFLKKTIWCTSVIYIKWLSKVALFVNCVSFCCLLKNINQDPVPLIGRRSTGHICAE